jgi:hypothetical protein
MPPYNFSRFGYPQVSGQAGGGIPNATAQRYMQPGVKQAFVPPGRATGGMYAMTQAGKRPWTVPTKADPTPFSYGASPKAGEPLLDRDVSGFFKSAWESMRNVPREQRGEYLLQSQQKINERLAKYEYRLARGIPLSAEQQQQYDNLKAAFNDIQRFMANPEPYEQLFAQQDDEARRQQYNETSRSFAGGRGFDTGVA